MGRAEERIIEIPLDQGIFTAGTGYQIGARPQGLNNLALRKYDTTGFGLLYRQTYLGFGPTVQATETSPAITDHDAGATQAHAVGISAPGVLAVEYVTGASAR